MALFGKKDPCAICGGAVKGLLPHKIEKQLVCKECYGTVDLPDDVISNITLKEFKQYREFRSQNDLLKEHFSATHTIDLGIFSPKIQIDTGSKMFCVGLGFDLDKTIFEGKDIVSFVIKEDAITLYEGNVNGLEHFPSTVPDCIRSMTSDVKFIEMNRNLKNLAVAFGAENQNTSNENRIDLPNPFEKYNIEIRVNHPYWRIINAQMSAPTINNDRPDLAEYMRNYSESSLLMEELANALMEIAFSGAQVQSTPSSSNQPDAVDEIRRFKELLDQGIITEDEFAAKKRQLLGL